MLVSRVEFHEIVERLSKEPVLAFDTETTGLHAYKGDHLFSLIIASATESHYFNFYAYEDLNPELVLDRQDHLSWLKGLFENEATTFYAHNAKFDLAMLARENVNVLGTVHCTLAVARLVENDELAYSLDACVKRMALETGEQVAKSAAVEDYIAEHHLWEWDQTPGKKTRTKLKFFHKVPLEVIAPYGHKDAQITFRLGKYQERKIKELAQSVPAKLPSIERLLDNEKELTKTLFQMEKTGIKINKAYCEEAASFEEKRIERSRNEFRSLTGLEFVDSSQCLHKAFTGTEYEISRTQKGNPSFTDDVLSTISGPIAEVVREYRDAYKRCFTYFKALLGLSDEHDFIHCGFRQSGTGTGRLSCAEPNLQNVPKEENSPYPIRRAFVPREGFFFFMPDYDQMEYRLMLDFAGELELIKKVNNGLDVHQATADLMGVATRSQAKTLNFMLLYGGGSQKLATALGLSLPAAVALKRDYFAALPKVEDFIATVIQTARSRHYVFNWFGRRCVFKDQNFCYKAPNYLIQGGCADVVKIAMNLISRTLQKNHCKSRMLLQIHDEILFEIHTSEMWLMPVIQEIMEGVFPYRYLKLTTGLEHSFTSWADKTEGIPGGVSVKESGNLIQGASA